MYPDSCTPYAPSWVGQAGEPLASWQSDEFDLNFYFISALTVTSLLHRILTCYNEAKQSLKLPATPSCLQEVKETVPADVDSIHTVFKLRYWFIFLVSRVSISLNQRWLKKICPTVYLLSSMWMSERQQKVGELYFSTCALLTDEYRVNSLYVTFLSIQFRSDLVAAELEKIKRFNCILKCWDDGTERLWTLKGYVCPLTSCAQFCWRTTTCSGLRNDVQNQKAAMQRRQLMKRWARTASLKLFGGRPKPYRILMLSYLQQRRLERVTRGLAALHVYKIMLNWK